MIGFIPVGRLIRLIRAWQDSCVNVAHDNGSECFHFNTYTIAILVIFSMQISHLLPAIAEFVHHFDCNDNAADGESPITATELSSSLFGFFCLYGKDYQMHNQVISVHAGRWLESYDFDGSTTSTHRR